MAVQGYEGVRCMTAKRVHSAAFRVDASFDIGTGHVMRCLTLADALAAEGIECRFICREHPGHLIEHIRGKGYPVNVLPAGTAAPSKQSTVRSSDSPPHADWLGCGWQTDAAETREILLAEMPDWLIVDHYAIDARWERVLQGSHERLMVIDDLADRPHVCDLLLDQSLGRELNDYAGLVPTPCKLLVGPMYALLRPEFAALREYSLRRRRIPALKRILIAMGGVDQQNATSQVLEALRGCPLPADCRITVIMGARAPWLERIWSIAAAMPWATEVLVNVNNVAQIMAESDLAIGAAGSTSWERCCLGLPTIMMVIAENQRDVAGFLEKCGAVVVVTLSSELGEQLRRNVHSLLLRPETTTNMVESSSVITDGNGTPRVKAELLNLKERTWAQ